MKRYGYIIVLLSVALLAGCATNRADRMEVSVTTYNLLSKKFHNKSPWELRRDKVAEIIRQEGHRPDILGCEEVSDPEQMNDLVELLRADYDYREMGIEASPRIIFWRKGRFDAQESGNIDLLAGFPEYAPDDYFTSRFANYVRLRERNTGCEVLVYLVHVKSGGRRHDDYQLLRRQCIQGLCRVAKAESARSGGVPVIAMGDLNNYAKNITNGIPSAPLTFVEEGFADSFDLASERVNAGYKTYSSQACIDEGRATRAGEDERLDYIFLYPSDCATVARWAAVINFLPGSEELVGKPIPSDHHPVNARLTFHYTNR